MIASLIFKLLQVLVSNISHKKDEFILNTCPFFVFFGTELKTWKFLAIGAIVLAVVLIVVILALVFCRKIG